MITAALSAREFMAGRRSLLLLLISGTFMMDTLDSAMISTPLPLIARDLGVDPVQAKGALTAYFLAVAALLPLSNWLSDRFGPRRVFMASIAVYLVRSLLCAVSPTLTMLVAARVLQGVGSAMLFPIGRTILLQSVSKQDLVRAMSSVSILPALAVVVGPLLAGYIATFLDWRLLFLINVPIGLAALALALFLVPNDPGAPGAPFDGTGFMLSSVGIAAIGYGVSTLGGETIALEASVALSAIGALFLALYLRHSRRTAAAVLDLSLFRHRTFRIAISSSFIVRAAVVGALPFLLPMMLQVGFGLTPFESGSITVIGAIASLMGRFIIGPTLRWFGFRRLLAGTAVFGALSMLFLAFVSETTPHLVIMAIIFVGALLRLLQILGVEAMVFSDVRQSEMGQASCVLSVAKQLAASAGVAYAALVVQSAQVFWGSTLAAGGDFRMAIAFVAVPLALTTLLSLRLSKEDGAEMAGRAIATKQS
jgi:EmrB/QacA subfamily drug resistance transporter